ncbi:related to Dynein intermediate chain 1, cytosolic [Melanopsichium pennsylvanicum]|uniref:Related to Dynein intermediate chain 1, cytosolic n=2 Tax=Melanopsichium pennsylvanicum TaxID=63383 RepID=A0AAJ4XQP0_9BASI|nr:related to Dynein intermediate chain 1, cytosolic [Melanopsichium pennsylvanicum 4]SNX87035.1 related to Dynein intermediate chain 1, cytosolic [Melanopsichium pennsylvanicum]
MSSSSSAADARRKAEIESKKAKLAEIRRQREERQQRLLKTASSALDSSSNPTSSRKDLDDLVNSLITGQSPSSRSPHTSVAGDVASPRKSLIRAGSSIDPPSSEFGGSESEIPPSTPGGATAPSTTAIGDESNVVAREAVLVDVEKELFELPQKQRVFYTKEVQTASIGHDDQDDYAHTRNFGIVPSGGVVAEARVTKETEESLRTKLLAEIEADRITRAEEDRLEREIATQLRELTESERIAIYSAQDFSDFVEHSTKVLERALTDTYDYMKDYRIDGSDAMDSSSGSQLRMVRRFGVGDKMFANRSVTAMDWSTKHPELVVVAYNRNDQDEDSADGLVAVWNMHLGERPEFVFHAQTDVLSVCFSPFHPNLIVGGTYSGQILIWDTRARQLPILKTPLSAAGHTHPVYGLKIIGSANAHNLVSASTDGTLCWWMLDMLAKPQETLELVNAQHSKTDEVAVTTLGLGDQETTSFLVGSEDGCVYAGNRYDRAGLKAGLNMAEVYKAHVAPITGIDFHPLNGNVDFSDLFLTSSMDWTSKLWRLKPAASANTTNSITPSSSSSDAGDFPRNTINVLSSTKGGGANGIGGGGVGAILNFEESNDYIYDIRWSPTHPSVFAQVDGTGRLDVYNLNIDTERPIASGFPTTTPASSSFLSNLQQQNGMDAFEGGMGFGFGKALNKLAWSKNGKRIATGGSDGVVYVYEVKESLSVANDDEFSVFQSVVARLLSSTSSSSAGSTKIVSGTTSSGRLV